MKSRLLKIFLILVVALSSNILAANPTQTSNKVEFNQKGVVDKIEITPNDLFFSEITEIKVYISEKEEKLTRDSIITLTRPEELDLFSHPKDKPIPLMHGDIQIGIAYTTPNRDQIIVEFNENVEDGFNHKGSFFISARAQFSNPTNDPNEIEVRNYTTKMGTDAPEAPYTIKYKYVSGKNPYAYKPDGIVNTDTPEYVNWYLEINRDRHLFRELTIVDTLHSGQELPLIDESLGLTVENINIDDFYFKFIDEGSRDDLSIKQFIDEGYGTFEFLDDNVFRIIITNEHKVVDAQIQVAYRTKITEEGKKQPFFYNDAIFSWNENGEAKERQDIDRKAQNQFSGGEIAPERFTLRVSKLANSGVNQAPLPNVKFKLFNAEGTPVEIGNNGGIFVTDENGQIDTPPLTPGEYYVTELEAPDYVTFDPSQKYPFEIKLNDQIGVTLYIENDVIETSVSFNKVWNDNQNMHPTIKVYLLADGELVNAVELSNGETSHSWDQLPKYTTGGDLIEYTIVEEPVEGYDSEIVKNNDYDFTITNTPNLIQGELSAHKLVSEDKLVVGDKFTYTIKVSNTTPNSKALENIVVSDTLPSGIKFTDGVIYLNGTQVITAVNDTFTYTLPTVEYGKDYIFEFEVEATVDSVGTKVNKATITNPVDPDNPLHPEVPVEVYDLGKLEAEKLVSEDKLVVGDKFTYTIKVSNTTPNSKALENIVVSDTLPLGIKFTDGVIYLNGTEVMVATDDTFTYTLDLVEYGKDYIFEFEVEATIDSVGSRVNKATITNPVDPDNPLIPEVPVEVYDLGKLEAEKLVSEDKLVVGDKFTYTIKVSNTTPNSKALENIVASDTLPSGIKFTDGVIYLNGTKVMVATDDTFTYTLDLVEYGKDYVFEFEVEATVDSVGTRVNKAMITNPVEPDNPLLPEVPVTVTPEDPIGSGVEVPKDPEKPVSPKDDVVSPDKKPPVTGLVISYVSYVIMLFVSLISLLLLRRRRNQL